MFPLVTTLQVQKRTKLERELPWEGPVPSPSEDRRPKHAFICDISVHPAMSWTREELTWEGPRPEHAFIEDNFTHPVMYRIREEASMRSQGLSPSEGRRPSISSSETKLLHISSWLLRLHTSCKQQIKRVSSWEGRRHGPQRRLQARAHVHNLGSRPRWWSRSPHNNDSVKTSLLGVSVQKCSVQLILENH